MPMRNRTAQIAKWCLGAMALILAAAGIQRLERDRPLDQLESAGADVVLAPDGQSGIVKLTGPSAGDEQLAYVAQLRGVSILHLSQSAVTCNGIEHLNALPDLRRLDLSGTPHAAGSLEAIGRFGSLRSLDLGGCQWVRDEDLASLHALEHLESLSLSRTTISDVGLAHLARVRGLVMLDLSDTYSITDAGLAHLNRLPQLQQLKLDGCRRITEEGVRELSSAPTLELLSCGEVRVRYRTLQEIRANNPRIGMHVDVDYSDMQPLCSLGAKVFISQTCTVRSIVIDGQRPGEAGLVVPGVLPSLRTAPAAAAHAGLVFDREIPLIQDASSERGMTDEAFSLLKKFPEIQSVELRHVPISDAGLGVLGEVRELQSLTLEDVPITDRGLEHLWQLPNLRQLTLHGVPVTGEGLAGLHHLTQLQITDPNDLGLTEQGLSAMGGLGLLEGLTLETPVPMGSLHQLKSLAGHRLCNAYTAPHTSVPYPASLHPRHPPSIDTTFV